MRRLLWTSWILLTLIITGFYSYQILASPDKSALLIGEATHGHHQIELACGSCHTSPFGGGEVLQEACIGCHGADLEAGDDSHPLKKFTDPRNADRLAQLEASQCMTCHLEHQQERTGPMGVTLPEDFCVRCHADVADERPSHAGMAFDTCASAGCHNYHDNRALYEDFLVKHAHQPDHLPDAPRTVRATVQRLVGEPPIPDAPADHLDSAIVAAWLGDAHALAGVNCSGCHVASDDVATHSAASTESWIGAPDMAVCQGCHADQVVTFTQGRHGMRMNPDLLAQRAPWPIPFEGHPMTPADGRLVFKDVAMHESLTCNTCHQAHDYDTHRAATEACLGCHADEHSRSFPDSPHATRTDLSCASCHMPGSLQETDEGPRWLTSHNQNANLRPNEKMIRTVCQSCHGLSFSIDALADPALIQNNFNGQPRHHIDSVDMAVQREQSPRERP